MSSASGEQALLTAGCAQIHRFYKLPGGAAAANAAANANANADAKLPDMQAGWEQAMSNVMAGLTGQNLVYEAADIHASLLGFAWKARSFGRYDLSKRNITGRQFHCRIST